MLEIWWILITIFSIGIWFIAPSQRMIIFKPDFTVIFDRELYTTI